MNWIRGAALAALFGTAACAGDATGGGGAQLTPSERQAMSAQMMTLGSQTATTGASREVRPTDGPDRDSEFTFTHSSTHACRPSGTVQARGTMEGTFVDATRTGTLDATLTVTHAACGHRGDGDGPIFVTGDPNLVMTLHATSTNRRVTTLEIRHTGAFTWTRDEGDSGRCTVDITGVRNATSGKVEYTGSFCGHPVEGEADEDDDGDDD